MLSLSTSQLQHLISKSYCSRMGPAAVSSQMDLMQHAQQQAQQGRRTMMMQSEAMVGWDLGQHPDWGQGSEGKARARASCRKTPRWAPGRLLQL